MPTYLNGRMDIGGNRYGLSPDEQTRVWSRLSSEQPGSATYNEILNNLARNGSYGGFDTTRYPQIAQLVDTYASQNNVTPIVAPVSNLVGTNTGSNSTSQYQAMQYPSTNTPAGNMSNLVGSVPNMPQMPQTQPYSYNPQYWQPDTGTNPFIDSSGGFSYAGLPGMYNTLNQFYNQQMGDSAAKADALTDFTAANLTSSNPANMNNYLQQMVGTLGTAQGVSGLGGQQNAFNLLGNLAGGNVGSTTPLQNQISSYISGALGGSGLTPEYVQAMRESVLNPSQENLVGQLNRMGGGQVAANSGLQQELLRRNESDFNNQLIRAGFENVNNLLGQGTSSEASNYQNALNTANSMGNLSQSALANALSSMGVGSNLYGTNLSALLGLGGNQQTYAGNMANAYGNLASNLLGYKTNYDTAQMQADALKNSSIGQSVANIANTINIGDLIKAITGGGSSGGGTTGGGTTGGGTTIPTTTGGTTTYPPTFPPSNPPAGGDTTPVPNGTSSTDISYGDYVPSPYDINNPLPYTNWNSSDTGSPINTYQNPTVEDLINWGLLPPNYNDINSNSATTLGSPDWTLWNPTDWGFGIGGNLGSSTWPYSMDWGQYDTGINNMYWNGTQWVPYG